MATERKEQIQIARDRNHQRQQQVVKYAPSIQNVIVSRVGKLLWLATAATVALLSFRFILMLIAANPNNGFVRLIDSITKFLVTPFIGITDTPEFGDGAVDIPALFAIAVCILAAWGIVRLVQIVFTAPPGTRHVTTIEQDVYGSDGGQPSSRDH